MTTFDNLYSELKAEVGAVANPLFDRSEYHLQQRDNFLPHAAVLTEEGEVMFFAAAPESGNDWTNSTEILPVLHAGLRQQAKQVSIKAVGIAENVTITLPGKSSTAAVKVLFEHRRGLAVALYLPYEKQPLNGYVFGSTIAIPAKPEVNAWGTHV